MIDLNNIHSLTEFKRNASTYIEQIQASRSPLVLTVNGKAAVVVQEAGAFQALLDRMQSLETEMKTLKVNALRQDLALGIQQLDEGQYTEYAADTMGLLFDEIKSQGRTEIEKSQ
jgi:PHD/YefM family antitoxin component YafN of YafNO toxin-antitoxin module